jgi:hypothetical protein
MTAGADARFRGADRTVSRSCVLEVESFMLYREKTVPVETDQSFEECGYKENSLSKGGTRCRGNGFARLLGSLPCRGALLLSPFRHSICRIEYGDHKCRAIGGATNRLRFHALRQIPGNVSFLADNRSRVSVPVL